MTGTAAKNMFKRLEIIWNNKQKDKKQLKFYVPTSSDKKWWQFYKKDNQKISIEILDIEN